MKKVFFLFCSFPFFFLQFQTKSLLRLTPTPTHSLMDGFFWVFLMNFFWMKNFWSAFRICSAYFYARDLGKFLKKNFFRQLGYTFWLTLDSISGRISRSKWVHHFGCCVLDNCFSFNLHNRKAIHPSTHTHTHTHTHTTFNFPDGQKSHYHLSFGSWPANLFLPLLVCLLVCFWFLLFTFTSGAFSLSELVSMLCINNRTERSSFFLIRPPFKEMSEENFLYFIN